jgi:hypothetical protein
VIVLHRHSALVWLRPPAAWRWVSIHERERERRTCASDSHQLTSHGVIVLSTSRYSFVTSDEYNLSENHSTKKRRRSGSSSDGDGEGGGDVRMDGDYIYDVTDSLTGGLHPVARRHICPFVNEISDPSHEVESVCPAFDGTGALHLLLGHRRTDDGCLVLPLHVEREILMDYGTGYEPVRLRQPGYFASRRPDEDYDPMATTPDTTTTAPHDEDTRLLLDMVERETLSFLRSTGARQIRAIVRWLQTEVLDHIGNKDVKTDDGRPAGTINWRFILERSLVVALVLRNRVRKLWESETNEVRKETLEKLLVNCKALVVDFNGQQQPARAGLDSFQSVVLRNAMYMEFLTKDLGGPIPDIISMSSRQFEDIIIGGDVS